ncbi:hypothetical protein HZS_3941 [Henneguya salminicola]|nr:hypothetical protein HZS_3941 [Henneguya salminicola]
MSLNLPFDVNDFIDFKRGPNNTNEYRLNSSQLMLIINMFRNEINSSIQNLDLDLESLHKKISLDSKKDADIDNIFNYFECNPIPKADDSFLNNKTSLSFSDLYTDYFDQSENLKPDKKLT